MGFGYYNIRFVLFMCLENHNDSLECMVIYKLNQCSLVNCHEAGKLQYLVDWFGVFIAITLTWHAQMSPLFSLDRTHPPRLN